MTPVDRQLTFQTTTLDDSLPAYRFSPRFRTFAEIAGCVLILVSALAFACLLSGQAQLLSILRSQSITAPATVCLALCGLSLALQARANRNLFGRRLGKAAALAVVLETVRVLVSNLAPSMKGPLSFIFAGASADLSLPSSTPQVLAASLLLAGVALVLMVEPPVSMRQRTTSVVNFVAGTVSLLALVGYSGIIAGAIYIPASQALALTILFLGILLAQPDRGPIFIIISDSIGGLIARRLFFTALGVPLVLAWMNHALQDAGLYEASFGSNLLVALIIILTAAFILVNSASLENVEKHRIVAQAVQRENERRLTIQYMLTRVLAESANVSEAALKVLQTVCQSMGFATGCFFLVEGESLSLKSYFSLPGLRSEGFEAATRETDFKRNISLPGKVWSAAEPMYLSTAVEDPNLPRARVALKLGLHAGFAFPILAGSEVIGVVEFLSREAHKLDDGMLQIFNTLGDQLGQFIQQKLAEEALGNSQRLNRMIIERAYDSFIAIDESGKIIDWNAQAEQTFGWTREEALGRSLDQFVTPPVPNDAQEPGTRHFRTKSGGLVLNRRHELLARKRDGQTFPAEMALIPLTADGRESFCAFVHDITERKSAEEVLVETMQTEQKVAQAIVEHAPLGIARLDDNFVIKEINPVFCSLLKGKPEELLGKDFFELLPGLPRSPFMNTLRTGEPFVTENYKVDLTNNKNEEDKDFWDIAVWPIMGDGQNAKGIVLLAADATGRVELVRQREDFVATLTHDLKAPLMGADRTLEMLFEEAFGGLDENEKEVVSKLRKSNQDLLNMIENLLEIYRYESGTEQFIFEDVDLAPLINGALNNLGQLAKDKQLRVKTSAASDLDKIQGDPMALTRVLNNLIMNAIKFTPPGGTIEISAERFEDKVMLKVKDSGIGIKPEEQEKIFQRFWRAESSIYKTGSGLGLYLCWQIVSAHHGKITCESEHKKGTTFSIALPLTQQVKSRAMARLP